MTDDYARPRSMADAVVEQATAAPGETRGSRRLWVKIELTEDQLDGSTDEQLGRLVRDGAELLREVHP